MTDTDALSIEVGMISSPHPHAPMHVKTLETLPEVTAIHLCGVADEDTDALGEGASKVQSVTTSIDELLARPEVTALVVCTRNDLCPDILNAAVEAGKPVLFEKPGALTAADLRAVAERAHERGLTMGTFFQNRWNPAMRDAVEVCRSGALGRIMAVEARMVTSQVRYRNPGHWLFRKDTAGTGILSWLGCHYLDLLCYFLDDRVVEVAALVGQQNPEQIEGRRHGLLGAAVLQRGAGYPARRLSPDRERSRLLRRRLRHLHGLSRYGRLPAAAARNGRLHGTQPGARLGGQGQAGPRLRTGAIAGLWRGQR